MQFSLTLAPELHLTVILYLLMQQTYLSEAVGIRLDPFLLSS